jgi:hypothetical protein
MKEVFVFLGRLSLGEFLIVWTSVTAVALFYLLLLYYLSQIEKDLNVLMRNIKKIYDSL